jgi:hypothetical protein
MEVGIPRADARDAVFAEQHRRMQVVTEGAAALRDLRECLGDDAAMACGRGQDREPGRGEQRLEEARGGGRRTRPHENVRMNAPREIALEGCLPPRSRKHFAHRGKDGVAGFGE